MPSFLLHTGGGNLPDTGQKTGGRHFNLPDSDQNMFSQPEKVQGDSVGTFSVRKL